MNQLPLGLQQVIAMLIENGIEVSMVKTKNENYDPISYDLNLRAKSWLIISTRTENVYFFMRYNREEIYSKLSLEDYNQAESAVLDLALNCIKDPNVVDEKWRDLLVKHGFIEEVVVPATKKYLL